MTFKVGEIVYFDNPHPQFKEHQGAELRVVLAEGAHERADGGEKVFGYLLRDENKQLWIVKGYNLRRGRLFRGDMDELVSWYSFGLATGWHKRPEDLT